MISTLSMDCLEYRTMHMCLLTMLHISRYIKFFVLLTKSMQCYNVFLASDHSHLMIIMPLTKCLVRYGWGKSPSMCHEAFPKREVAKAVIKPVMNISDYSHVLFCLQGCLEMLLGRLLKSSSTVLCVPLIFTLETLRQNELRFFFQKVLRKLVLSLLNAIF